MIPRRRIPPQLHFINSRRNMPLNNILSTIHNNAFKAGAAQSNQGVWGGILLSFDTLITPQLPLITQRSHGTLHYTPRYGRIRHVIVQLTGHSLIKLLQLVHNLEKFLDWYDFLAFLLNDCLLYELIHRLKIRMQFIKITIHHLFILANLTLPAAIRIILNQPSSLLLTLPTIILKNILNFCFYLDHLLLNFRTISYNLRIVHNLNNLQLVFILWFQNHLYFLDPWVFYDKIRIGVIARRTTIATLLTFHLRPIDPLKYPLANAADQFLGDLVKL